MRKFLTIVAICIILFTLAVSTGKFGFSWDKADIVRPQDRIRVLTEESVIIAAVENVSPSVVTISVSSVQQDIGTGFIVDASGLIVTNKHVASVSNAKYKVITKDDKTYSVEKIYRDPTTDLAILKISPPAGGQALKPVVMGDSSTIKVGQMAIAIGTALGEFRNTVTVGVVSGVGRGITAGSPYEGFAERLDNVIQTDAAINPGNSGGPLLNSSGRVIGINTAISSQGQNIGFAIPINIVKDALEEFRKTGSFQRPYLGVGYRMITKGMAIQYEVPEGSLVIDVVSDSPASEAGLQAEDIITKIDGQKVIESDGGLAKIIASKKIGDSVRLEVWRNGETRTVNVKLSEFQGE